jgi:hypothetical protein
MYNVIVSASNCDDKTITRNGKSVLMFAHQKTQKRSIRRDDNASQYKASGLKPASFRIVEAIRRKPCTVWREASPVMDLLRPAPTTLCDLRHHRIRRKALQDDARLQLIRPATPARCAREQLHAPRHTPLWVVRSVVRLEHCLLHGTVRKRSRPTPLRPIQGPRNTAYSEAALLCW